MLLSVKNKAFGAVLALLAVSACAEYQNHWDTVTLGAGNASEANLAIQTVNPFPPNAGQTQIDTPGDNL
jgi:hypothetical protein